MTEATKRPWYASHDGNGYDHIQSAAVNEDNYVARVDSTDAQGNANADLIVKAVNSHDALVAALEAAYDQLPCVCGDNFETCDCAVAKVTAALSEQVK